MAYVAVEKTWFCRGIHDDKDLKNKFLELEET